MFLRINTGLRDLAAKPPFGHRFGVALPLHSPGVDGLPIASESEQLNGIEDELSATFESSGMTVLAVVITTSGFREFVFYTSVPHEIPPAMEPLKNRITTHKLQFYVQPDPDWGGYVSFIS
jgi:Family of unknown function (DUF695)